MKISKFVSTIILTTVFSSIYLFGLIFWLYSNANDKTLELLKESLSTTSSFFGGITTLVAAYIAARLFNDWKEQHNKSIESQIAFKALDLLETNYSELKLAIDKITHLITLSDMQVDYQSTEFIEINLDPHHIKRLSLYDMQIKKFSSKQSLSSEFIDYKLKYEKIRDMTILRIRFYNDYVGKNMSSKSHSKLYQSILFITDDQNPTTYGKTASEYESAFEKLFEHLAERNKAKN